MYSINGTGTTLYGKTDTNPNDKSYIATEWLIVLFLPIVPIASYRVWKEKTTLSASLGAGFKTDYRMEKVKINYRQIIKTYLATWFILICAIIVFGIFLSYSNQEKQAIEGQQRNEVQAIKRELKMRAEQRKVQQNAINQAEDNKN